MLASIALMHSVQNVGLTARREPVTVRRSTQAFPPQLMNDLAHQHHWEHAHARFPQEPRVALAALVARPEARRMPNRPGSSPTFMTHGFPSWDKTFNDANEPSARQHVQRTIDDLGTLVDRPHVGPEARLRRGILFFHRADLDRSLRDVQDAAAAAGSDTFVEYLGHLYAGMIFEALGRSSEAADAYARAFQTISNARAAAVALSSRLFLDGRRTEAAALMERTFADAGPTDPWIAFSSGDYRFWPQYRTQLREAIGR